MLVGCASRPALNDGCYTQKNDLDELAFISNIRIRWTILHIVSDQKAGRQGIMANRLGSLGTSSALLARTATTLTARAVAIQRRSLATKGMDRASSDNASKGQVLGHQEHDHDHSTCGHDHSHDHHHHSHNHGPSPSTLIRPTAAQTVAKGSRLSNQPSKVKSAGVRLTKPIIGVEYCENLVRKADYEGFLCSQFFPADQRSTQMALRAFNIELASIRESVSNIDIGRIRMQFWRDSLDKIFAVCLLVWLDLVHCLFS